MNETDTEASAVSRRTLMKTAAGVGVAAAAVGVVGVAHAASAPAATTEAGGAPRSGAHATTAGPIVVHVTDLKSGTVELFTAGSRTQINDVDLAARIARAAH